MDKINLVDVFQTASRAYRKEWKILMKISGIRMLLAYMILSISFIINSIPLVHYKISIVLRIVQIFMLIFTIYFSGRLYAAQVLASKDALNGKKSIVKLYYQKARIVTWRYIGYRALLHLMYIVPLFIVSLAMTFPTVQSIGIPPIITISTYLLGGIPILVLSLLFYFSHILAVVCGQGQNVFGHSVKLLKGNILKVLIFICINVVGILYCFFAFVHFDMREYNLIVRLLVSFVKFIPLLFLCPFFINLKLVFVHRADEKEAGKEFEYLQ